MRFLRAALARGGAPALTLLVCALSAFAQQGGGTLRGQVVDPLGGVVPGAAVTVTDAAGRERMATTGGEGVYVVNGLAPGTYDVRVSAEGFAPYESRAVTVEAGGQATLDVKLEVRLRDEEVSTTVTNGGLSVDPDSPASGLVLREGDLKAFSDDPDQLAEELSALAGAPDGPSGARFFVDGFSGGRLPPKSSIREVRVNQNPFTAEQDALGFGRVEIFTKPGSGETHGQAFFSFSDESLNARNPFAPSKVPFQVRQYGGNISGPINKRTSYFFDFEKRDIDENAVVSALTLDASLAAVRFDRAVVTPQRRTNFTGRLDRQLSKDNTLVGRYGVLHYTLSDQGVGGFALPSVGYDTGLTEHTLQLTETAVLSTSILNETRFQFLRTRSDREGDTSAPTIDVLGAFTGGGSSFAPLANDTDRYELNNATTWANGNHTIRFGGRLRVADISDVSRTNFNGRYVFSSLEQYRQVLSGVAGARPAQFTLAAGNAELGFRQTDFGAFAQDDWRLRPNFMLSYGLRVETQTNIHDKLDFAPRVNFAWAPGAGGRAGRPKTVIRGGVGVFYFRFTDELTLRADRYNGVNQRQFVFNNPDFFPNLPPAALLSAAAPQTVWRVAPDMRAPYSINAALSVERQFPWRTTLGVTYLHETDRHLLRARNVNAPLPGTFTPGVPGSGVRPLGNVGNIYQFESSGVGSADAVYFNLRTQLGKRVSLFSLSRLFRETGNTESPYDFPANSYDMSGEYGRATTDMRASAFVGTSMILPWRLSLNALVRVTAKNHYNIITGVDSNGDTLFTERPAFAADLNKPGVVVTPFGAFDPNPDPGETIIPRNFGVGPSTFFANLRVSRVFGFGEKKGGGPAGPAGPGGPGIKILIPGPGQPAGGQSGPVFGPVGGGAGDKPYNLTLSFQVQNLFNHTNFGPYIGNLSSPLFGRANSVMVGPRRFDFQVRFGF